MDHFKKKYIKYKTKYINLQNGGIKKFLFKVDESILPQQLIDLLPDNIYNNHTQFITIENELDHTRLLNLIRQNKFIVYNIINRKELDINNYDINALKNATNLTTIFLIKNISEKLSSTTPRSGQLSSTTPRSGQFDSFAPHSGPFDFFTPRSGQLVPSTPRSRQFDSLTTLSRALRDIEKRKTEGFKELASSTPRSKAWFDEIVSSTPRSQALREELVSSTPRSQALREELVPSTPRSQALRKELVFTPRSQALRDELVSSTPLSRALEYVSKKRIQQYVDLYNRVVDLINQIEFISYNDLPQQLQLIIECIKRIIDQKIYGIEDSEQKKKVLDDIKTNFFINSIFNDNIKKISNNVARSVSSIRKIEDLSKIIYKYFDLVNDFEIEMDVENDEDFAFDTALNLTFEDLINPLNLHRVTITNALRQIMELRNAHVYLQ